MAPEPQTTEQMKHLVNCQREIMRHADDSAAYLLEPCTCAILAAERRGARAVLERLEGYLAHAPTCHISTYQAAIDAGQTVVMGWPNCTCRIATLIADLTKEGS